MKNNFISFQFLFVMLIGCQQKESPNIDLSQIIEDIKWNDSYSKVEQIFEKKYNLEFDREIKQQDGSIAYKYIGGKINGIKSQSWTALFAGDSLHALDVMILSETDEQNSDKLKELKNDIEALQFDKQLIDDDFWVISIDDKSYCGINLVTNQNVISAVIHISKKFNKYTMS